VLLGAHEKPDGTTELWLAESTGTPGITWSVDRLGLFAYQLGLGQARHAGRTSPEPWLSRRWLAQYIADRPITEPIPWDHPAARDWSDRVRNGIRPLWEQRFALVAQSGNAPRTLCHLDVWPMNLIAEGERNVLLDWAFTGEGALGEDVANLIVDSFADGFLDAALLPEVEAATTDGYLRGLRDGGWHGDPEDVRRAIALTGAAKYAWLAPAMLTLAARGAARGGSPSYDPESTAAQVRIRCGRLLELLVNWAERLA
jgi:Phosphotransferase enzyme family